MVMVLEEFLLEGGGKLRCGGVFDEANRGILFFIYAHLGPIRLYDFCVDVGLYCVATFTTTTQG